jgi:mRNA interferase MazF
MPSKIRFERGDLVLLAFPFSSGCGRSSDQHSSCSIQEIKTWSLRRVTTSEVQTPLDVIVSDWKAAGLLAASSVRLHKIATIQKALIRRRLGRVTMPDWQRIITSLREQVFYPG